MENNFKFSLTPATPTSSASSAASENIKINAPSSDSSSMSAADQENFNWKLGYSADLYCRDNWEMAKGIYLMETSGTQNGVFIFRDNQDKMLVVKGSDSPFKGMKPRK